MVKDPASGVCGAAGDPPTLVGYVERSDRHQKGRALITCRRAQPPSAAGGSREEQAMKVERFYRRQRSAA
jgi:hypothetical protein